MGDWLSPRPEARDPGVGVGGVKGWISHLQRFRVGRWNCIILLSS